nr:histidine kinase N-terminal 7TM domain-containing protein [uncultured Methanoregula sp.]
MIWQYSPYFIPYVACGAVLALFAFAGWKYRTNICGRSFTILMAAASLWAFCTALELASADLPTQMLAIMIEYPAMVVIPVAWFLFAIEYIGREEWITAKRVALLLIVPAITVILVVTNGFHHLFYPEITETVIGGLSFHVVTYGPAFWIHSIYSYSLIFLSVILILQRFLFSSPLYRRQVTIILIATILPFAINLVLVLRVGSVRFIDPTPFALLISGFFILYGMLRFQLLDISPIAHEQILENMNDGVIVSDLQGRIISLNKSAGDFLGIDSGDAIGRMIREVMPDSVPDCLNNTGPGTPVEQRCQIERQMNGKLRYFELKCVPLRSPQAGIKGQTIQMRDITDQKQTEKALNAARQKLSLLSSITRHDILNQVTALLLQIEVAKTTFPDPAAQVWLAQQEGAVVKIQNQVEFARDYEDLGAQPPRWTEVSHIFSDLKPVITRHGITCEIPFGQIEIFADPLFVRVFHNLVHNSIQHGGHVTVIRLRYEIADEGLFLIYEDNGIGIPVDAKKDLFRRDANRQTGLGLFLVAEILGITGMTIRECGILNKGARFEICIPYGQFRIKT